MQLEAKLRRARRWIFLLAVLVLSLDQASKSWAVSYLSSRPALEVLGDLLKFNHTSNSGAAFNIGEDFTLFLTLFALLVTIALVLFARKVAEMRWAIGFGLLLGGVLGNLLDRIFREPHPLQGHVVDFIQIPRWPIFNVADIAITLAGVWITYLLIKDVQPFVTFGDRSHDADRE